MQLNLSNFLLKNSKTTAFLLGGLAVQALPPFYHWFLLFVCLTGLLWLIHFAPTRRQAFAVGYWFGFAYFACGLAWVNNALLVTPEQTGWLIPITFLASGAFFGLFIAIPALLTAFNKPLISKYLAFAGWIVVFEWIRSWLLTGFPWNLWGSCLAFNVTLLQSASVFGSYGLSLLTVLAATAPIFWLVSHTTRTALTSLSLALVIPLCLFEYGYFRIARLEDKAVGQTKIRLVQPSIPQAIKWSPDLIRQNFQQYIDLSQKDSLKDVQMIIWGETASPYPLDIDQEAAAQVQKIIPEHGFLTTGAVRYEKNNEERWQPLNSALVINHNGLIEDFYDKIHLVPFGEYLPLRHWIPDTFRPLTNTIADFKSGNGFKRINLPSVPTFGIQICYEIIFPHQIFNPQEKPEWLINLTNDGWYGISSGPYQHLAATQLRAAEEGLTILRSANSGISALINRYGKILARLDLNQRASLDVYLPQQLQVNTLYNRFGNLIPLILALINILAALLFNRKERKSLAK